MNKYAAYPRGKSVFKNYKVLDFDYVPKDLPHRDSQLQRLFTIFGPIVDSNVSQNAFITGPTGSGKTVISKKFCMDFQDLARKARKNVQFVLVNCRQRNTENAVMLRVLTHFQPYFPDRGFSINEMMESLRKELEKEKAHLIVVLDEVDVLLKKSKSSDIIYHFSRFNEEGIDAKKLLSLILISQKNVYDMLDLPSISTFKRGNIVKLDKYSKDELHAIVDQRIELAFHPDSVDLGVGELISDMASEWGDARFAIELLEKAGMLADENKEQLVTPEHARAAKAQTYSTITESKLNDLDKNRKLILMAISRCLKKKAYTTTGDAEKMYSIICEEFEEKKLGHTQFWKYLKELDDLGIIQAKKSSKGLVGTTTLISLPDIPAKVLEEKLAAMLKIR
ncbi:MAG: AAA family ATPase [Thermoplasmata archaeon]|nr:MAG: AAA family ATPase [Thermoplasmata archaeon]